MFGIQADNQRPRSPFGQALVETAILLPILLILLLGAIDFGRAFFGWVNLHQAVRIGADYASLNPNMTATERDRFVELIEGDTSAINCALEDPIPNATYTTSAGLPAPTPVLGDYATLTLRCDFAPVTPLIGGLIGDPLTMRATSTFPVRDGCINCPTPVPATPPPPPVQCFLVPNMEDMSVAGAREAWNSAGFSLANFTPSTGQDSATVATAIVHENDPNSNCAFPTYAIFTSSVTVTTRSTDAPCLAGSAVVPNVIGVSVATALTEWEDAGFDPSLFTADGAPPSDTSRVVVSQDTEPDSTAGVGCLELTAEIDVTTGEPWPDPPEVPCFVPNMIQLTRAQGETRWIEEGFSVANFTPSQGGFTIRSQSLVGGTYVPCTASIAVGANP